MLVAPLVLTCIALDDEPLGLAVLQAHAAQLPGVQWCGGFTRSTEALRYLHTQPVDLLLLDIRMPDLNGLELARMVPPGVQVVFTTAYPEYAAHGFDLAATDYLLKPISFARFQQACDRVRQRRLTADSLGSATGGSRPDIFVKAGYEWVRIAVAELLFIEAADNYVFFHEATRRVLTRLRLSDAVAKLPADQFQQVHKSFVIALAKLERVERQQVIVAGHVLPLSPTYRPRLRQYLNG